MDHIKRHYYMSHPNLNPHQIVPKGPVIDFDEPSDRAKRFSLTAGSAR